MPSIVRAFLPSTERIHSDFSSNLCIRRNFVVYFKVPVEFDRAQGRGPNGYSKTVFTFPDLFCVIMAVLEKMSLLACSETTLLLITYFWFSALLKKSEVSVS